MKMNENMWKAWSNSERAAGGRGRVAFIHLVYMVEDVTEHPRLKTLKTKKRTFISFFIMKAATGVVILG